MNTLYAYILTLLLLLLLQLSVWYLQEQERRLRKMRERLLKEEVDLMRGGRAGDRDPDEEGAGGRYGSGGRGDYGSGSSNTAG